MKELGFFPGIDHLLYVIDDSRKLTKLQERNLIADTSKLSTYYLQHICNKPGGKSMKKNIQQVHDAVYWLLEKIYVQQQHDTKPLRDELACGLCSFLHFLQKHSGKHFDYDAAVPVYIWMPVQEKLSHFLNKEALLFTKQGVDGLGEIIQSVFNLSTTAGSPTYRDALYWEKLLAALQAKELYPDSNLSPLLYTLLRYNFNHSLFIHFLFQYYINNMAASPNPIVYWQQAFLEINRVVPVSGFSLLHEEEDGKKSLLRMIRNEINAAHIGAETGVVMENNIPYAYHLTVSQLAVYFRMLVDSGMINTHSISEMLRHFAANSVSAKGGSISAKSLYNNFHQPEKTAVKIMMDYNTRMRNILMSLLNK